MKCIEIGINSIVERQKLMFDFLLLVLSDCHDVYLSGSCTAEVEFEFTT